jgi:hypothetical protein
MRLERIFDPLAALAGLALSAFALGVIRARYAKSTIT